MIAILRLPCHAGQTAAAARFQQSSSSGKISVKRPKVATLLAIIFGIHFTSLTERLIAPHPHAS